MIAIISCTKSKFNARDVEARKLYFKSSLFRLSYLVIKKYHPGVPIYILSAKYGLISETAKISTYNKTLLEMSASQRQQFAQSININEDFIFIGGSIYKSVLPKLPFKEYGANLPIGKKMQYLKGLLQK